MGSQFEEGNTGIRRPRNHKKLNSRKKGKAIPVTDREGV
jgi:hypothetical protein